MEKQVLGWKKDVPIRIANSVHIDPKDILNRVHV